MENYKFPGIQGIAVTGKSESFRLPLLSQTPNTPTTIHKPGVPTASDKTASPNITGELRTKGTDQKKQEPTVSSVVLRFQKKKELAKKTEVDRPRPITFHGFKSKKTLPLEIISPRRGSASNTESLSQSQAVRKKKRKEQKEKKMLSRRKTLSKADAAGEIRKEPAGCHTRKGSVVTIAAGSKMERSPRMSVFTESMRKSRQESVIPENEPVAPPAISKVKEPVKHWSTIRQDPLARRPRTGESTLSVGKDSGIPDASLPAAGVAKRNRVSIATSDIDLRDSNQGMDFGSTVEVLVFKKVFYRSWKNHVEKFLNWENPTPSIPGTAASCAVKAVNTKARRWLRRLRKERGEVTPFSSEGQMSLLRCYDEIIRAELGDLYPQYKQFMYPTKTPNIRNLANITCDVTSLTGMTSGMTHPNMADLREHLERAGSILDAVREVKGDQPVGEMKERPQSRDLIKSYNTWTRTW